MPATSWSLAGGWTAATGYLFQQVVVLPWKTAPESGKAMPTRAKPTPAPSASPAERFLSQVAQRASSAELAQASRRQKGAPPMLMNIG
jgi:hypothetical protein